MNPFRLSAADTIKIGKATFRLGDVDHNGYVLRRDQDGASEFHSNESLMKLWLSGLAEPQFARRVAHSGKRDSMPREAKE